MKSKKILGLILFFSILPICSSLTIQTATAKVTRTEFEGYLQWKGGGEAKDWTAGQTAHRRDRVTILNITSDSNFLDGANLTRIVNYNRNNQRNTVQRWGKFEIKYDDTVLWRGSWTGSRGSDTQTVENYVGHGVRNDLVGLKIKFTITDLDPEKPGTNMTGIILTPPPARSADLSPSYTLLGAGSRWAARGGKKALFVNWYDNWLTHHATDGSSWVWLWSESTMIAYRSGIASALEEYGFKVTFAGDIPTNLGEYDLVVLSAYYAIEPQHTSVISEYIENGGGVVMLAGTPCYLKVYCKDLWPFPAYPPDFSSISWLGAGSYRNANGKATLLYDNPLGTQLKTADPLLETGGSCGSLTYLDSDAEAIAVWNQPTQTEMLVFAYTYEYGSGRLYYQSIMVD